MMANKDQKGLEAAPAPAPAPDEVAAAAAAPADAPATQTTAPAAFTPKAWNDVPKTRAEAEQYLALHGEVKFYMTKGA